MLSGGDDGGGGVVGGIGGVVLMSLTDGKGGQSVARHGLAWRGGSPLASNLARCEPVHSALPIRTRRAIQRIRLED